MPEFDEMLKLVLAFIARAESAPFREPVDWKGLGILDYLAIVKHPMDLGTIRRRLENNEYSTIEEAAADMRLVWTNCMTYNQDGSEYYQLADTFARKFEEKYAQLRRPGEYDSNSDPDRIPSLEEKTQLTYDIFKIDTSELGRVLVIIQESCPGAIVKDDVEDEVLINFDAMTPRCFHEVNKYVQACTNNTSLVTDSMKARKKIKI